MRAAAHARVDGLAQHAMASIFDAAGRWDAEPAIRAVGVPMLKFPATGFVDPRDERMVATVAAIHDRLGVPPDGFLRRYSTAGTDDGLAGDEGAFLLCGFWLVDALAMQGDVDAAEDLFERLLAVSNDVGLFAEEYDASAGELLGNFPQAFTHLGVIQSAFRLDLAHRTDADRSGAANER